MRRLYTLVVLLVMSWPLAVRAQQPFEQLGVKVDILSLTHGRFPEYFENDSLRRIGSVVYDTRLERVAYLLPPDSLVGRSKSEVTARWLSVDPLAEKDAHISPYVFCRDNAILYKDPDGREVFIAYQANGEDRKVKYVDGKLYNENGSAYTGKNPYVRQVSTQINQLRKGSSELAERLTGLQDSKMAHTVMMIPESKLAKGEKNTTHSTDPEATKKGLPSGSGVEYNPNDRKTLQKDDRDPRASLAHELLGHSPQYDNGTAYSEKKTRNGILMTEVEAVKVENVARKEVTGDSPRTTYGGRTIPSDLLK